MRLPGDSLGLDIADLTVRLTIRAIQVDRHFRRSGLLGVRPDDVPTPPVSGDGHPAIGVDLDDFAIDLFEELCVRAMRSPADLSAILVQALAGSNRRQVEMTGWPLRHQLWKTCAARRSTSPSVTASMPSRDGSGTTMIRSGRWTGRFP